MSEQAMTGLERLKRLVVVLEAVKADPAKAREFDIETWSTETPACGTHYCACGWATTDPILAAEGLHLVANSLNPASPSKQIAYGDERDFEAVRHFFGITYDEADHLFYGENYRDPDDEDETPVTIDEVIERVTACIAEYERTT